MAYFGGFRGTNLIILLYNQVEPTTLYPCCMECMVIDHGCDEE